MRSKNILISNNDFILFGCPYCGNVTVSVLVRGDCFRSNQCYSCGGRFRILYPGMKSPDLEVHPLVGKENLLKEREF